MAAREIDRRGSLRGAGGLAPVPLVGTALAAGPYQPTQAPALGGSAKSVVIKTHEWAGERDERLDFPADREIEGLSMQGSAARVLTAGEIGAALDRPIGARPVREIAAGRKRVAVTFDDLTRPTPAYAVMPWMVAELTAAGVRDEDVWLLAAYGSHRAMTLTEVQQKPGEGIANRFARQNHNVFENVKEVGVTSFKNRTRLNQSLVAADLTICVSGVKALEQAGVSGGAKAVQEVAKFYAYMASDDASFFTGSMLMMDGGFTAK
jgi:nickel-dependent lactate racemase